MKFNVIVSDPAWSFSDTLKKMKSKTRRSAISQYSTLSPSQVAQLDVRSIADPEHCVLVLWVPSTLLQQGLSVMSAWGFSFKQTYIWVKTKKDVSKRAKKALENGQTIDMNDMLAFGMGRLFRQTHEIALIGTMGKVYSHLENKSQRSVEFDFNKGHSTKPELLQDMLELMFPNANKLEMFGRRLRPNWTVIGDGVTGKDITLSIQELAAL